MNVCDYMREREQSKRFGTLMCDIYFEGCVTSVSSSAGQGVGGYVLTIYDINCERHTSDHQFTFPWSCPPERERESELATKCTSAPCTAMRTEETALARLGEEMAGRNHQGGRLAGWAGRKAS